jgi:hypothetical protein
MQGADKFTYLECWRLAIVVRCQSLLRILTEHRIRFSVTVTILALSIAIVG